MQIKKLNVLKNYMKNELTISRRAQKAARQSLMLFCSKIKKTDHI